MAKRKKRKSVSVFSRAALKGWATRRRREAEAEAVREHRARAARARRAWEARREREAEAKAKEARRLKKWRKSYRKFLEFRIPKKAREELEIPEKRELVCRVLFDSDETEARVEHFWSNIRHLIGDSISNQLARVPAESGVVRVAFKWISAEDFQALTRDEDVDPDELGDVSELEWDTDFEPDEFWRTYFDHARERIPRNAEGKSGDGSLLVVKMQVCYLPGQVSTD